MDGPALGVDFGTTQSSAVAVLPDDRLVRVKDPMSGSWSVPTCLCRRPDGTFAAGAQARMQRVRWATGYIENFKRDLAEAPTRPIRQVQPRRLVAAVLEFLRTQAEVIALPPWAAVQACVPAAWENQLQEIIRAAFADAGFPAEAVEITPEPVAAAHFALTEVEASRGDVLLLYDLGGGTFDSALLRAADYGEIDVIGYDGVPDFGGIDIDELVIDIFREQAEGRFDRLLSPESDAPLSQKFALYDRARKLKHALSMDEEASDELSSEAGNVTVVVSREMLEARAEPLMQQTIRSCDRLLERAGMDADNVARIITVGGGSRMPIVRRILGDRFGRPVTSASDPELAIAHGAALVATARRRAERFPNNAERRLKSTTGGWTSPEFSSVGGRFVHAAFVLGEMLWERNRPDHAEEWYHLAANANHARAAYQLGWLGKQRDDRVQAQTWWEKAARAGDCEAAYYLGELLWEDQKPEQARPWFLQAADGGHAHAAYQLGWMHRYAGDDARALAYYRSAAEKGDYDASLQAKALESTLRATDAGTPAEVRVRDDEEREAVS